MKLKATIFLLLSMSFSSTPLARQRPELFSKIERAFQENEPAWRAGRPLVSETSDRIRQSLVFRSGRQQASVDVAIWRSGEEARKAFAGESLAFDKRVAKRMVRGRLPELGDENHLWTNRVGAEWPVLKFRRDNINVTVFAPSVAVARRFAQHVLQEMAPSEQGPAPDPDQGGGDAPDRKSPQERAGGPPARRPRGESQGALSCLLAGSIEIWRSV